MTDRPTIFSAAMVRGLLREARSPGTGKRQTRRLATSPLRKCEVGDRLYVRESWRVSPEACEGWHPDEMRGWIDYQAGGSLELTAPSFDAVERATFLKGDDRDWDFIPHRYRPSIHMPRWTSRLTLIVEGVKIEPLQATSEADAIAEGIHRIGVEYGAGTKPTSFDEGPNFYTVDVDGGALSAPTAAEVYALLWDHLHGAGSWAENPDVLALTFHVIAGNIDQVPA